LRANQPDPAHATHRAVIIEYGAPGALPVPLQAEHCKPGWLANTCPGPLHVGQQPPSTKPNPRHQAQVSGA